MARQKITYSDKENIIIYPEIAEINKITAANMNQIKSVVNAVVDEFATVDNNVKEIKTLKSRVSTNETNIAGNASEIAALKPRVTANEENIAWLKDWTEPIDKMITTIGNHETRIDVLERDTELSKRTYDAYDVGTIVTTFKDEAPDERYLPLNGQAISRTEYAELYAILGQKYGSGNGSTTFNLPNQNYTTEDIDAADIPYYYYYMKAKKLL